MTWNDSEWSHSEGERSGLWVDLSKPYGRPNQTKLLDLISSSLLVYRVMANFGAPPYTKNDAYKCVWSFALWNCEDTTCMLEIFDHKGWPEARFCSASFLMFTPSPRLSFGLPLGILFILF